MKVPSKFLLVRSTRKVGNSLVINTYLNPENGSLHTYKNDKIYLGFTAAASKPNAFDIHEMFEKIQIAGIYIFDKNVRDEIRALLN